MNDSTNSSNLNAINCLDLNEPTHDSSNFATSNNHITFNYSNVKELAQGLSGFIVIRDYVISW